MSFINLGFGRQTMTPKQKEELREMYQEAEKKEIDEIFSEHCPECGYQFGLPQGTHQEECPQCTWTPKSIEEFM